MSYLQEKMYATSERYATQGGSTTQPPLQPIGCDTTESPSHIRNKAGEIEAVVSVLHAVIDRLEKRLDTVLTPVPPSVAASNKLSENPKISSHFNGRLESIAREVGIAVDRVGSILNRVEV